MRTPALLYAGLVAAIVAIAFVAFGLVAGSGR